MHKCYVNVLIECHNMSNMYFSCRNYCKIIIEPLDLYLLIKGFRNLKECFKISALVSLVGINIYGFVLEIILSLDTI